MSYQKEIDSLKIKRDQLEAQLTMKGLSEAREHDIRQQISDYTKEITAIYAGHLRVERFSQEWFAQTGEQTLFSLATGAGTYAFGKLWGLPTVQARVLGFSTGFLRFMYGTEGMQRR